MVSDRIEVMILSILLILIAFAVYGLSRLWQLVIPRWGAIPLAIISVGLIIYVAFLWSSLRPEFEDDEDDEDKTSHNRLEE